MRLRSLANRTDLIFPAFEGQILDRGAYLVVRTPSVPTFYWGNFLLFRDPPAEGDQLRWPRLFAEEIGRPPEVAHQTFGWDSPEGERGSAEGFLPLGFRLLESVVLATSAPHEPPRVSDEIEVRPLHNDGDWQQAVENQVRCRDDGHDEAGYRRFKQDEMARYRRMAEAGLGEWFGAFLGDQLVADLGVYRSGDLGRYQTVETHPSFRRRGFAAALVYRAARHALEHMEVGTLVIVADSGSSAERLYRSVGFLPVEKQLGLERW